MYFGHISSFMLFPGYYCPPGSVYANDSTLFCPVNNFCPEGSSQPTPCQNYTEVGIMINKKIIFLLFIWTTYPYLLSFFDTKMQDPVSGGTCVSYTITPFLLMSGLGGPRGRVVKVPNFWLSKSLAISPLSVRA